MDRLRIASLQYFIRPVRTFEEFAAQVEGLVATAADYKCRLLVFPEWFTVQLLTLGNVQRPIEEQVRDLAHQAPRIHGLFTRLARQHRLYIAAGTMPVLDADSETVHNECLLAAPSGASGYQRKLHMTRFESEEWMVKAGRGLRLFSTDLGLMAITICYDVEFPELARAAARMGAEILIVPSCTDDRQGFLRVRYCAHARAIENQLYVVHSSTVGSLPMVPAVSLNWGQASILSPSDFAFPRDGIVAEGVPNQESMVIGEINLELIREGRAGGTVLPLRDSQTSAEVASRIEEVHL